MPNPFRRRFGSVIAAVAAGISIGAGAFFFPNNPISGPSSVQRAVIWIDTAGGSCHRFSLPVSYTQASSAGQTCPSLQAADVAALPGDVIYMRTGNYVSQTITKNQTTPGVTVMAGDGGTTTLGGLITNGDWFEIDNITIQGRWGIYDSSGCPGCPPPGQPGYPSHVTCRVCWSIGNTGTFAEWRQGDFISWIGGGIINQIITTGHEPIFATSDTHPLTHITLEGLLFDNNQFTDSSVHTEMIRIDSNPSAGAGPSNWLIDKNTFCCNNTSNTSTIFITSTASCTTTCPSNITFENNYFGSDQNPSIHIQNPNVTSCTGLVIRYNTFQNTASTIGGCSTFSGTLIQGNIGTVGSGCDAPAGNYVRNVWLTRTCGATDISTSNLQYTAGDGGFAISNSSPATAHGDPGFCPNTDHDGTVRPQPAITTCDAGAFEVN